MSTEISYLLIKQSTVYDKAVCTCILSTSEGYVKTIV